MPNKRAQKSAKLKRSLRSKKRSKSRKRSLLSYTSTHRRSRVR